MKTYLCITCCCCCQVTSVVSNPVRPHRRQPTRLPRPWDSPGKNSGVGCHLLLQGRTVKSESEVTQSCLTLRDPMDGSLPGSAVHGIFQARVMEWGAIAFSNALHRFSFNIDYLLLVQKYTTRNWDHIDLVETHHSKVNFLPIPCYFKLS